MSVIIRFDGSTSHYHVTGSKNARTVAECLLITMRGFDRCREEKNIWAIRELLLGTNTPKDMAERFDSSLEASIIHRASLSLRVNDAGDYYIVQINDGMKERGEIPWASIVISTSTKEP